MEEIRIQLEDMKNRGFNINDSQKLMNQAVDEGYFALAIFIADHRRDYLELINS